MLTPVNDPKYAVKDGKFVNRHSGEAIPDDEPVFIFRGRDWWAAEVLEHYAGKCADPQHERIVRQCAQDFADFAAANPNRMKEPDTER